MSEALDIQQVREKLVARVVGRQILYHSQLSSTNDEVRRLAVAGEPEGTVVVAETQTAGRGRRGRRWLDVPGQCLLFSILLRPDADASCWPLLSLGMAVAAEAIRDHCHLNVATKWPNDLLVDQRKVGGILLEAGPEFVVAGLGLNVTGPVKRLQDQIPQPVTTLEEECGHPVSREEVLVALLEKIDLVYSQFQAGQAATIIAAYKELDCTLGKYVMVEVGDEKVRGWAADIGPRGTLIIQTDVGLREIAAGDVYLLSDAPANSSAGD